MGCGKLEREGYNGVHLIPAGATKPEQTCLELGITEFEEDDTGRKTKLTSSLKGFWGYVKDLAFNTDLNRKDGLQLCWDYSGDIIPMDIEEYQLGKTQVPESREVHDDGRTSVMIYVTGNLSWIRGREIDGNPSFT